MLAIHYVTLGVANPVAFAALRMQTVSLFTVCAILLPMGVPGWAMAVTAIYIAPVCVTATIYAMLSVKSPRCAHFK